MDCPACGKSNREGARFCRYCASVFTLHCTVCDAELVPDSIFCDSCGAPVAATSAPQQVAASRKVVTVLFADLVGSTALEERMDAESVRSILDRFYAAMRSEVERHGGRVVKFTGDGLMAAFGVPEVHEDDAARAVDAALAMRNELEELASDLGLDLALKSGINTGEVVVSGADDDVVGDAVNVASRLEGAAVAGEVLVGEDTWRLTRATSRYEPIAPLVLKGKSEPVPAYRLLSVDERTADSAAAPFVGREAELDKLLAVFQDAVDAKAGRLVTIIGSPGLGKTRLARELMSELAGQARVGETRCDPAGAQTLAPIADLLRAAANISETDAEDEVIAKLAARLPDDEPDRDRIAMRVAPILGVGLAGTTEETFWALRRLIESAASTQPVVLVLDDLHWAEPLLLDLVEHLAEWISDAPVLLVGTARPELRDMRPSLVEGGRAASVIALEGLDQDATSRLALNLLDTDELPAELLKKIPASTEGNPLFVRELVRMLVDDGVLLRTQDGWSVTVDVEAIQVPPTIQSLLSARVDRLRHDERTVIELASVVGKEFYRGALYDLAPAGVRDLVDGCLESLRRKELVEPVGTYWIDEPVYRFHHVLIRDAVYRRLLKESRAELHERVAGWLQEKTADVLGEHDELLGYHLEQAHEHRRQLGRDDDELGRRAAELLGAAAKRALDRDDLPAAATLSGRALERLPAPDEAARSELLLIRCEALLSMRDVAQGSVAAAEFERLASTPRLRAWATCFSGHLAILTSPERLQETETNVAAAAAELAALGDQAGAAKAHTVHASALATRGRFAEGEAVLDAALSAARAANDRRRITATLGMAPHAALWGPNPVSRAGGRCLDIVRLLRITTGSPAVEATSLRCQAVLEAFRGRADAARRMLRSARRTLTDLGLQREVLETDQFAGIVEIVAGDPAAALSPLRSSYEGCRAFEIDILAAQSAALLARAHLTLGEIDNADELVAVSERLGSKDLKTAIDGGSVKAEILARRGAFDEARQVIGSAVALAEQTDALFDQGNVYRSLARVLRAAGDAAGAKGAEDRASALFERKGATALVESARAGTAPRVATAGGPTGGPPRNACARAIDAALDRFKRDDLGDVSAPIWAENVRYDDRRRVLAQEPVVGREALIDNLRGVLDVGMTDVTSRLLGTRGECLALAHVTFTGPRFDWQMLAVLELDDDELVSHVVVFDADNLDAAFAELDESYIAGEGAICAAPFERFDDLMRELNERDWAEAKALFLPDATVDDRTPASRGEMSIDRFLASFKELVELTVELCVRVVAVHAASDDVIVAEAHNRGVSVDGVEVDLAYQTLVVHREGRIARLELFPVDRLDLALQRFDQLAAPAAATGPLTNRCLQIYAEYMDAFNRRDIAHASAMLSEDTRVDDRRAGLRSMLEGRAAVVGNLQAIADLGPVIGSHEPIAVRGDRLALVRNRVRSEDADGFTAEALALAEIDEDDRYVGGAAFDPEDFDEALAELDERYLAHEGAVDPELVRLIGEFGRAYTARDLDLLRSLFTEDLVVVDHRPASSGTLDLEGLLGWLGAAYELTEEAEAYAVAVHAIEPGRVLNRFEVHGTTSEGGLYETAIHLITERRGDRIARAEQFAVDHLDLALRRFEELSGARGRDLDNRSMETLREVVDRVGGGDWESFVSLYTDTSVIEDRRRGLRVVVTGRDEIVEFGKTSREAFGNRHYTCLAVRGERLALARGAWKTSDGSFHAEVLRVGEIDDEGRVVATVFFDPEDLDAAFTELDERYASAEASLAQTFRLGSQLTLAINTADWDAVRALLADDLVIVDHRPASLGELHDPQAFVDSVRTLAELTTAYRMQVVDYLRVGTSSALVEMRNVGTSREGGTFENTSYVVSRNAMDKVVHLEIYPPDQRDAAVARFDELDGVSPGSRLLENRCTRTVTALFDTFERKDLEAFLSYHAETFTHEDRRTGMRHIIRGREELTTNVQAAWDIGGGLTVIETIAIRGERLALNLKSYQYSGSDRASDFVSPQLIVDEVDDDGRAMLVTVFDPEQLDDAFAELDRRYASGEGAEFADVIRPAVETTSAWNARDWTRWNAVFAEDVVFVDHRPVGAGEVHGRDRLTALSEEMTELVPDIRHDTVAVHAIAADRIVVEVLARGMSLEGGTVELAHLNVCLIRDGLGVRIERFDVDQLDEALARFDELGRADDLSGRPLANAASRNAIAGGEAVNRGDWDAIRSLYAPDVVIEDRRRGLGARGVGVEAFIRNFKIVLDLGFVQTEQAIVATRGESLALLSGAMTNRDGNVIEGFFLFETNEDCRSKGITWFDADDLHTAFAELDERYSAGEGAAFAETVRAEAALCRTLNARDWDAFRVLFADDFVLVDHRHASLGTIDLDGWLAAQEAKIDLVPTYAGYPIYYHGLAADRWWVQIHASATTDYDTDVDFSVQSVGQVRDGRIVRLDTFLDSQTAEAQALFEAVGPDPSPAPVLENECTRHRARWDGLFAARDWDAQRQMIAEDVVSEDRRAGLRSRVVDAEPFLQALEVVRELGPALDVDVVAIRGEHLALFRMRWRDPSGASDGFAVDVLQLHGLDNSGLLAYVIVFDPEDMEPAVAELDERYLAGEGAPFAEAIGVFFHAIRAYNRRDWTTYRGLLHDDFVQVDHRPAGAGTLGLDAQIDYAQTLLELAPNVVLFVPEVIAFTSNCLLARQRVVGTTQDGAEIELPSIVLGSVRDGRGERFELFPPERLDEALARFEKLAGSA